MAIASKFSIMCDEVRVENNGKFLIMGMYTPDMAVPQLPFVCPVLTFLLWLECTIPGNYQFSARIAHLESGTTICQAMGGVGFNRPGLGLLPVRLVGVQFTQIGPYTFSVQISGEQEILHHFSVILPVPVLQTMPGITGPR